MKKLTVYEVRESEEFGDSFSTWHFTKDTANTAFENVKQHLTPKELDKTDILLIGYSVSVPEDYSPTTAEQLTDDLYAGDVISPDYDSMMSHFTENSIVYEEVI